ncbi:DUF424 family protein [Candidatus Woesearchaeota archaeon]|nr:DUF424 family protein [Candidatus Woesearchaeota archaeon]
MYVKIHNSQGREVVAICDEGILGKKFEEGDLFLDVSESFYKGEKKNEKEVEKILNEAENINLAGEKTISIALRLKVIDKENIIWIKGVPHAQLILL